MGTEPPEWYERAACLGMGNSVFFPETGNYAEARSVCAVCEVWRDCLEMALSFNEDDYGMFGGKTPRERGAIRWQRMKA